ARSDIARLHGRRRVDDEDQPLRSLALQQERGSRQRGGQEQEGQQLEQEQRVELQPLEERRRLLVPEHRRPQEDRGHAALLPADLEEVQEEERHRQPQQQERPGLQEAHWSRPPLRRRRSRSSTGMSVTTRT